MQRLILILLCCLCVVPASAQLQDNVLLKRMLQGIYIRDQQLRHELGKPGISAHIQDSIWKLQGVIDSVNLVAIEKIIAIRGYPGKTMVGEQQSFIAWSVIQHSEKIKQYFPAIKRACEEGELSKELVAMMEDRLLLQNNKPQRYGTQWREWLEVDSKTGKTRRVAYIWPIEDAEHVNPRRYVMDFEIGILEYSQRIHAVYDKTLTVQQLQKMSENK